MTTRLDQVIAGLSAASTEQHIKNVLAELFRARLSAPDHDRQAEAIRRITRMNRGTFKRHLKHAQAAALQPA